MDLQLNNRTNLTSNCRRYMVLQRLSLNLTISSIEGVIFRGLANTDSKKSNIEESKTNT